ncbi:MAG: hypothetical protein OQJ84_04170, partial [Xanthomonadales bacterium]|nr:hypothetical protein [Xanthomonadales bacterium]
MDTDNKVNDAGKPQTDVTNEDPATVYEEALQEHPELEDTYLGGEYKSATIKKIRACPESISKLFKEGKYPYTDKIKKSTYEKEKK